MNSDADCVVKAIKQLIQLSLGEVTDFKLRTRALDKQLQYSQIPREMFNSSTRPQAATWPNGIKCNCGGPETRQPQHSLK